MATRLAVQCVFRFRTPLSGDHGAVPSDQAHLRSHSGPGSSRILLGAPTGPEFSVLPEHCRTLVFERLRLPLDVVEARCECGTALDTFGRHRGGVPTLRKAEEESCGTRERTLARICREAGATVRCNARLRDMNVVSSTDDRLDSFSTMGHNLRWTSL